MNMKIKIFLLFLISVISLNLSAQKIGFIKEDLAKAKAKAAEENKLIFVDAYTTWCGPCKWMDANVFSDKTVAKFYKNSFVNLKLDMEKGDGLQFAQDYRVAAFPSFYYLTADGEVAHMARGAFDANDMMKIGTEALSTDHSLAAYQNNYQSRKTDPDFLLNYSMLLKSLRLDEVADIASDYLATQTNWGGERNTKFIFDQVGIDIEDDKFKYMLNHIDEFYKHITPSKVDVKILNGIHASLGPEGTPDDVEVMLDKLLPTQAQRLKDKMYLEAMLSGEYIEDIEIFTNMAYFYVIHWQPTDWEYSNNLAWIIYENGINKAQFEKGKDIALQSISMNDNYFNNDTAAALFYMMSDKKQALKYAYKALNQSEAAGLNSGSTQALIQMIEGL